MTAYGYLGVGSVGGFKAIQMAFLRSVVSCLEFCKHIQHLISSKNYKVLFCLALNLEDFNFLINSL